MQILDLTLYQDGLHGDGKSILQNGTIYSINFHCFIIDVKEGWWMPFDTLDYYIPIEDEEQQHVYLESLATEDRLCYENDSLAIYFLNRYYPKNNKGESKYYQKYYEFLIKNKTDRYLTFCANEDTKINGKMVGSEIGFGGGLSSGNYMIDYSLLRKQNREGELIMQYDEIQYSFYIWDERCLRWR